ncbi:hypothetical protein HA402_001137 [Bradysia odoriphaga]|nr:hypothetical protein HA402_001137 [Bradysia odoriphaga]
MDKEIYFQEDHIFLFCFPADYILSSSSTNTDVFVGVIEPMVESCKNGFNTTIFTYGEKASGKTYTMDGTDEDPGIKILAVDHLFRGNQSGTERRQFIIRAGYVEIYNEMIYDLLNRRQNVYFDFNSRKMSNTEVIVKDRGTLLKLLQKGNNAKTPKTGNKRSTSHTILQIIIESQNEENGPFYVSHLNLVDLDRSEGAQVKDECGTSVDKSLEYFGEAIAALGKGEIFRQFSKSKLTRILKTTLSGQANIAIICNINPTVLKQTISTLNFAEEAQKATTWAKCNKSQSNDVIMKKVNDELMKIASHPPSDSTKLDDELAELQSIILMGNDMQPKRRSAIKRNAKEVLKVRPFFANAGWNLDKKYQIGEMDGRCIDSQSRAQRKSMAFKWSDYYLERVGFEINGKMRRNLKYGKNLIGRSDVDDDIDICVGSLECSRKHCTITVADDESVSLTDLNSSNGTTINGVINKGQTVTLREGDVIGIVTKGSNSLSFFIGNFDCTVYRLRMFATETMQTYDLNDDSIAVVISDDEDDCDGTSYLPVKMEIDLPPPSVFIEVQTTTEEGTVTEESMVNQSAGKSQSFEDIAPNSGDLLADGEFPSCSLIVDDTVPFDDLGDIIGSHIAEVETSNLGNLARELDMLASVQMENARLARKFEEINRDYEKNKKLFAEEREVAQLKMVAMAEEKSKLTAETKWLQMKLTAITDEKNALQAENSKLRAIQNELHQYYKQKLNEKA